MPMKPVRKPLKKSVMGKREMRTDVPKQRAPGGSGLLSHNACYQLAAVVQDLFGQRGGCSLK